MVIEPQIMYHHGFVPSWLRFQLWVEYTPNDMLTVRLMCGLARFGTDQFHPHALGLPPYALGHVIVPTQTKQP